VGPAPTYRVNTRKDSREGRRAGGQATQAPGTSKRNEAGGGGHRMRGVFAQRERKLCGRISQTSSQLLFVSPRVGYKRHSCIGRLAGRMGPVNALGCYVVKHYITTLNTHRSHRPEHQEGKIEFFPTDVLAYCNSFIRGCTFLSLIYRRKWRRKRELYEHCKAHEIIRDCTRFYEIIRDFTTFHEIIRDYTRSYERIIHFS
jgi:hypothetical protein